MSCLDDVLIADFNRMLNAMPSKLRANAAHIAAQAQDRSTTTHVAARELAQERVLAAMKLRGRVA